MNEARRGGRPPEGEKTRLELRLDKDLAEQADRVAKRSGFSSLQQWATVLITREVRGVQEKPLTHLDMSTRLHNALIANGVATVTDVTRFSAQEILRMKNLGQNTLGELRQVLASHGLSLRGG